MSELSAALVMISFSFWDPNCGGRNTLNIRFSSKLCPSTVLNLLNSTLTINMSGVPPCEICAGLMKSSLIVNWREVSDVIDHDDKIGSDRFYSDKPIICTIGSIAFPVTKSLLFLLFFWSESKRSSGHTISCVNFNSRTPSLLMSLIRASGGYEAPDSSALISLALLPSYTFKNKSSRGRRPVESSIMTGNKAFKASIGANSD